ncbi:MAG: 30S ribosome-binding factor RbfA [Chloroflexota bacterium]
MSHRIERVNSLIREEISKLLQRQVKDPRLNNFVVVTGVTTSADLKYAKVFISSLGGSTEKADTLKALTAASGFFRRELAGRLKLRSTPELSFHWDDSIERGNRIEQLLDKITADETARE